MDRQGDRTNMICSFVKFPWRRDWMPENTSGWIMLSRPLNEMLFLVWRISRQMKTSLRDESLNLLSIQANGWRLDAYKWMVISTNTRGLKWTPVFISHKLASFLFLCLFLFLSFSLIFFEIQPHIWGSSTLKIEMYLPMKHFIAYRKTRSHNLRKPMFEYMGYI
jgi:hypothetical protein